MQLGVVFPQLEIGTDPTVIRSFAETAERLGFEHLYAYDHVLGANPDRPNWRGAYDYEDAFHEPFSLYSHVAAVTDRIGLLTGVLVLPQRQTALVAKQAAQVDVFSEGRLRLGVGIGWNDLEYEALGADFSTRGRRIEEQIEVLRRLWTEELVTFDGEFHTLPDVGINPLPVQRPIPIWMGGSSDRVLERVGRVADGYLPQFDPGPEAERTLARIRDAAADAARDPDAIDVNGRLHVEPDDPDAWLDGIEAWAALDVEYLALNPMYSGLTGSEHVAFLEELASVLAETGFLSG